MSRVAVKLAANMSLMNSPKIQVTRAFLRSQRRPDYESPRPKLRIVDLFSGCGGMSLGVAEAAYKAERGASVVLALDNDEDAHRTFVANFPRANAHASKVEAWFNGALGRSPTKVEAQTRTAVGRVDLLLAGPPCQGHSDLNNHTRRNDPRNTLYLRVIRAVEILTPRAVLIENVPAVTRDHGAVVSCSIEHLHRLGYGVSSGVVNIDRLGLPQKRRRHFLLAIASCEADRDERVSGLFVQACRPATPSRRTVRWAIEDLLSIPKPGPLDIPSYASTDNEKRMAWLFNNKEYDLPDRLRPRCHQTDHTYASVYGRLHWDKPAQTITTGFTSMGQGRFVHPGRRRTLTPHEAARLQGFPDFFDFTGASGRTALARLIGNAVPPVISTSFTLTILPYLTNERMADGSVCETR